MSLSLPDWSTLADTDDAQWPLLDAVLRAPQLNRYDSLAALALQLAPLAGGGR